ncbi:MAG TPA: hydroxymethylglutaryl-CoA reductase, degradative [Lentimicrobium sp.]|nr:hydroxymethylglutaryl-CoA reductase, degradative [Lentimicrobium sp.]
MIQRSVIKGFSKFSKEQKIDTIASFLTSSDEVKLLIKSFWHNDPIIQGIFDEFSENTLTNYFMPYGIAPNVCINGEMYMVPMVIEESSVIAAASKSAKFWATNGGFKSEIVSTTKIGQVHFIWSGKVNELKDKFSIIKQLMLERSSSITANMEKRGGGVLSMEIIDKTSDLKNYYQLEVKFETVDSMGANFINSCLEEYAYVLKSFVNESGLFQETDLKIIMAILSNYTPECLVKTWVETDISAFSKIDENLTAEEFAWKFQKAVEIAKIDVYRATTHNKGIFNGIDAVVLATGNDFRAVEACGHAFASQSGKYRSLTDIEITEGHFRYSLTLPLAIGTVGGLTSLHPMAKLSLAILGNPTARELMQIASVIGLANNFGALKSLTTKGIQIGHMKMHLLNILNFFNADEIEKKAAVDFFKKRKISYSAVQEFIESFRSHNHES